MTTIIVCRRNEIVIGSDGTGMYGTENGLFGCEKIYKINDKWLAGSCGWSLSSFEFKKLIAHKDIQRIFNKTSLNMKDQSFICDKLSKTVSYNSQESTILLWGINEGYVVNSYNGESCATGKPKCMFFMKKIISDHCIIGAGILVAEGVFRGLVKHKPNMETCKLVKECLKISGDIVATSSRLDIKILKL